MKLAGARNNDRLEITSRKMTATPCILNSSGPPANTHDSKPSLCFCFAPTTDEAATRAHRKLLTFDVDFHHMHSLLDNVIDR